MDRKIFTQDKVASLYNENFILAKYNAEKGEGEDLAKKYEVEAYPDYVFLNAEGKQIHRVGGFTEADDMIAAAKEAIASFQGNEEESAYINFEKQSDGWEKIKQKAIKEGKLVFLDCYAVWCGPCKKMDRTVFHEPGVVDSFDTHFINTKFDMEKGEGVDLKNKFNVQAYPTYLFISPKAEEIVHRIVGSRDKEKFLAQANIALNGDENLAVMKQEYKNGNRNADFIKKYLEMLEGAYLKDDMTEVATDYLEEKSPEELFDETNWNIFVDYYEGVDSEVFNFVLVNR